MGGGDNEDNLILLSLREHVEAHYLLAIEQENVNRQFYYANLNAAWIIYHGKSKLSDRKREEVEKWLSSEEAQNLTLKLKEQLYGAKRPWHKGFDAYKDEKRIWICKRTQKPKRILEKNRNSKFHLDFVDIPNCPICHSPNSDESFACCEEHEKLYLTQKKEEYKKLKSVQTRQSWTKIDERELRLKNNNGKHGPKKKHIWITNGVEDRCIVYSEDIPDGFKRGRSNNIPLNRHVKTKLCS